jgi:flagellar protein FlaG
LPDSSKVFDQKVDYHVERTSYEEALAMKIASLSYEPQDLLAPLEQTSPQRSNLEIPERLTVLPSTSKHDSPKQDSPKPREPEEISVQKLQHLTEAVDSYMSSLGVNLKFNIDERTDMVQVEVRDPKTDKLIRKIPADEMLDLAASIENMVGLFLDKAL